MAECIPWSEGDVCEYVCVTVSVCVSVCICDYEHMCVCVYQIFYIKCIYSHESGLKCLKATDYESPCLDKDLI
jgi:hypothetical protein